MSEFERPNNSPEPVQSSENHLNSEDLSKSPEPSRPSGNAPKTDLGPLETCKICGVQENKRYIDNACEACRKFYRRNFDTQTKCIKNDNNCEINEKTRNKCQHCRMEKCKRVGMIMYGLNNKPINMSLVKTCLVCGAQCSLLHKNEKLCYPCADSYFRSQRTQEEEKCVAGDGKCEITVETRARCKFCRYEKCKQVVESSEDKIAESNQKCKVCEMETNVLHCNKTACGACRNFFRSADFYKRSFNCVNDKKCHAGKTVNSNIGKKCKVCGDTSSFKYTTYSECSSCEQFYYKYLKRQKKVKCVAVPSENCKINMETRKNCKFCRFQKCVRVREYAKGKLEKIFLSKIQKTRSKNADYPRRRTEESSFDFSFSTLELSEIKDYAMRKIKLAKQQSQPKFDKNAVDVPDSSKVLNGLERFPNLSDLRNEDRTSMLRFLISSQKKDLMNLEQERLKLGILRDKYGFLLTGENGDEINLEIKKHRGLKEYRKYHETVKNLLEKARNMADERLTKVLLNSSPLFLNLIDAYKAIFGFNLYLFEHLLHLIARYVFNPYFIFWSEKSEDVVRELWKYLDDFLQIIPIVMDAYFSVEPLERQLEDLKILEGKIPENELQYQVYTLARCAMRNIRVPQTADKFLNQFDWINRFGRFNETFDLLRIPSRHFDSEYFLDFLDLVDRNGYEKETVSEQCTQILYKSAIGTLLAGLLKNSEGFFKELLDGEGVDRRMKPFYQNQVIRKVLAVVKRHSLPKNVSEVHQAMLTSAMISNYKYHYPCQTFGQLLNEKYLDFMKFPEVPLYISPSYVGVAFATFETDILVSVVKNCNDMLIGNQENVISRRKLIRNRKEVKFYVKCGENLNAIVFLNTKNGQLSIKMLYPQEKENDDRIAFGVLDLKGKNNEEMVDEIAEMAKDSFNDLRNFLDTKMRATEYPTVIGKLENPKKPILEDFEDMDIS